MSRHEEDRGFHPWRLVRRDIGRKATALAMAVLVWVWLSNKVGDDLDDHPELGVFVYSAMSEAVRDSQGVAGVYLIVPDDLTVRDDLSRLGVRISGRGLKDEIDGLRLSAFVAISEDMLEGADERQVALQLQDLDLFRARGRGEEPSLQDFEVKVVRAGGLRDPERPSVLRLLLARVSRAEFALGPDNVSPQGAPRDGYEFDQAGIRVQPNRVEVKGPSTQIEYLRADPSRLKLERVDIEGRVADVSQQVGLDASVDRSVLLETAGGVVEVTVPIRARDMTIDLAGVPVHYVGADALVARNQRVVSAEPTLDLKVSGPRSVLGGKSQEELVKLIDLKVDWNDVILDRGNELVQVFRRGLPNEPTVRITDHADDAPRVEYHLEDITMDDAASANGNGDTP